MCVCVSVWVCFGVFWCVCVCVCVCVWTADEIRQRWHDRFLMSCGTIRLVIRGQFQRGNALALDLAWVEDIAPCMKMKTVSIGNPTGSYWLKTLPHRLMNPYGETNGPSALRLYCCRKQRLRIFGKDSNTTILQTYFYDHLNNFTNLKDDWGINLNLFYLFMEKRKRERNFFYFDSIEHFYTVKIESHLIFCSTVTL